MMTITSKENLREEMFLANEKKKSLLKKRNSLLESKQSGDKENALRITHDIAKLEDFIRMAENSLRMSD